MIEKDLEAATIGEKSISWTLAQEDTLKLKSGRVAEIFLLLMSLSVKMKM